MGKITMIHPFIHRGRLRVSLRVEGEGGRRTEAFLPPRETAAFLPRSIICCGDKRETREALILIEAILRRLLVGRRVTILKKGSRNYAFFLSWKEVVFNG